MVLGPVDASERENASFAKSAEAGCFRIFGFMALFYRNFRGAAKSFRDNLRIWNILSINRCFVSHLAGNQSLHYRGGHGLEAGYNRGFAKLRNCDFEYFCSSHRVVER